MSNSTPFVFYPRNKPISCPGNPVKAGLDSPFILTLTGFPGQDTMITEDKIKTSFLTDL